MDKPRDKSFARNRKVRRVLYAVLVIGGIVGVTLGVSRLKPAAPTVERATTIIDTVKRGEMVRNVRGLGTLVPEDIVWITATTKGRIDKRLIQPGTVVRPDTILFEMSDPDLQQQLLDATARREATVQGINAHAAFLTEARPLLERTTADTTTALTTFRIP